MKRLVYLISICLLLVATANAQTNKFAIKTNLLYDATSTVNLGIEAAFAPNWSVDVSGNLNLWALNKSEGRQIKHGLVQPEVRYWLCEALQGHFFGINAAYMQYKVGGMKIPFVDGSKNNYYDGWATGVGISYGYSAVVTRKWNLEFTLGLGVMYSEYDVYARGGGKLLAKDMSKTFFTPTKAGISLVYKL